MKAFTKLQDFGENKLVATSILGAGAMGCVFKGTLNKNECVFKVIDKSKANSEAILSEYYIGKKVKELPLGINQLFAGSLALYYSPVGLPDDWKKLVEKATTEVCQDLINGGPVYIIAQEFVDGKTGDAWLIEQTKELAAEIIRPIIFQLVLALCYANDLLGFQHNDLKLENMFLIPSPQEKTIIYNLGDDTFTVVIPKGGATVRIIDFGFSSMDYPNGPNFLAPADGMTPGYAPFDLCMNREDILHDLMGNSPLTYRTNDADMTAIFLIMMNLVCHLRKAEIDTDNDITRGNGNIWTYERDDEGQAQDYIAEPDALKSADTIDPLVKMFLNAPGFEYQKKNAKSKEESVNAIVSYVLLPLCVLEGLGAYPTLEQIPSYDDTPMPNPMKAAFISKWNIFTGDDFQNAFRAARYDDKLTLKNQFAQIPHIVNECFGDESMAVDFCRHLYAPTAVQRRQFGVDKYSYCFANALYHPFLAYPFWSVQRNNSPTYTLPETNAPNAFRKTPKMPALLKDAKDVEQMFAAISNATAASVPTTVTGGGGASSVVDGELLKFLKTAIDRYKKPANKLNKIDVDKLRVDYITPMTTRVFKLLPKQEKIFTPFVGFRDANNNVLNVKVEYFGAEWKVTRFYAACMVYIYAAIMLLQKQDATATALFAELRAFYDTDKSTPVTKATEWNAKDMQARVKNLLQPILEFAKANGIESEIRDTISSHLEVIERNEDYLSTEGAYNLPTINEELYIPLQEAIRTHETPLDEKLIKHLGLGDELFRDYAAFHGIDMTDASNQTRYFHTLSIVANMMETGNYDQLERCYVEWPPKVHVAGQIHEI
jgi:serine/threonine protein kinase